MRSNFKYFNEHLISQIWKGYDHIRFASNATYPLKPCKTHHLEHGIPLQTTIEKADALSMYRQMKMIREMETMAAKMYRAKKINGFCHLCIGQEAVYVGLKSAMRPADVVISSYRVHGITYLMGATVRSVLGELAGRSTGCSRGKGGSMHMYGQNFYGGNGIVGSQVPLGAGLALACQYKNLDAVSFALYGDGASNNGQVFEAYNLAQLWHLPIVFVIENNLYAMGTSTERSSSNVKYYTRGDAIPGLWVDGMGVLDVREGVNFAIKHVKDGKGPLLLEVETYRYYGHSMSDPGTSYRSREEIAEVRKTHDPIAMFRTNLINLKVVEDEEFRKIDDEVKKEVVDQHKLVENDPPPGIEELATDIYSMPIEPEIRGVHAWQTLKHKRIGETANL